MIRHTILFKAKSNVSAKEIDHALAAMRVLGSKLSGISAIIADECHFHDEKSRNFFVQNMQGMSHAISIDFVDQAALDDFFNNAVTHPAKDGIVKIAENGYNGIIAFDLENLER